MIGSFLDCSGAVATQIRDEASQDTAASEDTIHLETLLDLEHSRGQMVGHLLNSAITMDCNLNLVRRHALLPTLVCLLFWPLRPINYHLNL